MSRNQEESQIEKLLAPLRQIEPVSRAQASAPGMARGRTMVLLALIVIAATAGVAAAVDPLDLFNQPTVAPRIAGDGEEREAGIPRSECQLLGRTADVAHAFLTARGLMVSWRVTQFGSQVAPPSSPRGAGTLEGGYTTAPSSVPPESVVWDIVHDPQLPESVVIVFVHAPDDANAPRIAVPDACRR
jgi:hypothetical protein